MSGSTSYLTQNTSFSRRSSRPIFWHSTEETKPNRKTQTTQEQQSQS